MSMLAIELNDSGVLAASENRLADANPGYAILKGNTAEIGMQAFAQSRLYPRETNHSFWHSLSLEPLELCAGALKTPADLACAHLRQIFEPYRETVEQVIIAVPASFNPSQLGLLLGICQQIEMPVVGLVDTAIAAVTHPVPGSRMLVVDATAHCFLISELQVEHGLRRKQVVRLDNIGLKDFAARWANCISDAFVKSTRFDPLHVATSEQWLYDSIPGYLEKLSHSQADSIEIQSDNAEYATNIDKAMLISAVAGLYQPIINAISTLEEKGKVTTVIFTHRVASLPGLCQLVEDSSSFRVTRLLPQAVTKSILKEPALFTSEQGRLSLTVQRPWQATPGLVANSGTVDAGSSQNTGLHATHVLIDSLAYALTDDAFVVGTSLPANQRGHQVTGMVKGISRQHCSIIRRGSQVLLDDRSTFGTFVNGKRVEGSQVLAVGDRVQLGNPGMEVRLIRQVDNHG